ncbi:MAG: MBL fold metallo-hydrolase [Desulfobacterales bacterium]|nr:MBL fold metallo-hydrolase [Deltaproteobacteria bacterium]NNK93477.1 MBL fold metallo-hydrolase [Desulfobacterales bacterium]
MQCRITTLADNTAGKPHIIGEWGFCALIETKEKTVLLDSGAGVGVLHNAKQLEIDLQNIDVIVLSHAHYDHTGGIQKVLKKIGKDVDVIAPLDLWAEKYNIKDGIEKARYIGVPYTQAALESLGAKFNMTPDPVQLTENIITTGEVGIFTDFEQVGEDYLKIKVDDKFHNDPCLDDRALMVKTDKGLIVVLGCAHRCLINTLHHARKVTGENQIYMVIGGCHLHDASNELIVKTINSLQEFDIQKIGVSHCTGLPAASMMAAEFGDRFFFNTAGTSIIVD